MLPTPQNAMITLIFINARTPTLQACAYRRACTTRHIEPPFGSVAMSLGYINACVCVCVVDLLIDGGNAIRVNAGSPHAGIKYAGVLFWVGLWWFSNNTIA